MESIEEENMRREVKAQMSKDTKEIIISNFMEQHSFNPDIQITDCEDFLILKSGKKFEVINLKY